MNTTYTVHSKCHSGITYETQVTLPSDSNAPTHIEVLVGMMRSQTFSESTIIDGIVEYLTTRLDSNELVDLARSLLCELADDDRKRVMENVP